MSDHPIMTFVALFVIGITITATDISTFIREIVPLVTALGVIYGVYVAAKAARTVKETSATVIAQQVEIKETTATTLGHVNSAATKAQATIDALLEKIALLDKTAAENKEIAANLAKSVELAAAYATVPRTVAPAATPALAPAIDEVATQVLKSIDSNTAAIDANTKKTTDDVEALKTKTSQTTADVKTLTDKS